ncbi:MAG: hypothetical protein RLZ47_329 [Bacteroidota bacterium]|jgi:hypothetical protein
MQFTGKSKAFPNQVYSGTNLEFDYCFMMTKLGAIGVLFC